MYTAVCKLGGAQSYVSIAKTPDNELVVIKAILKTNVKSWVRVPQFGRVPMEAAILLALTHENNDGEAPATLPLNPIEYSVHNICSKTNSLQSLHSASSEYNLDLGSRNLASNMQNSSSTSQQHSSVNLHYSTPNANLQKSLSDVQTGPELLYSTSNIQNPMPKIKKSNKKRFGVHANLIHLIDMYQDSFFFNLVLPYNFTSPSDTHQPRDLFALIESSPLEIPQINHIFKQIVSGISSLHETGIVHCDLKDENIVVDVVNGMHVTIIDFGASRLVKQPEMVFDFYPVTTLKISAPEVLLFNLDWSPNCKTSLEIRGFPQDVWSIGVVLYSMIMRHDPFPNEKSIIEFKSVDLMSDVDKLRTCASAEQFVLLERILTLDVNERVGVHDILTFDWLL